ncbi:hypothetical protein R2F61_02015 [Mollicutes bacterium LVI A0078]|nr:hypothetical protein RZE84_02045 [Mollicutes bacterium LVI A0075]WOO91344.1 hypothetical protein R2F61_02015 [Mollicutes bacterium LVI A0078]
MVSSLFHFAINMLIMFAVVYGFHIIGQIANKKFFNEKFKYSMPIGFAWFMITFQILSFPFILYQTRFSLFLLAFAGFGFLWLLYIFLNRSFINWKITVGKFPLIAMLVLYVFFILFTRSRVFSDSWLYSAMITSTIENNLIYSHNGTLSNVQLTIMHHRFESYYLWQAVLSMLFTGKYLIALITEYKLFDSFLIVLSFMELGHQFKFSKFKSGLFAFAIFSFLTAQSIFLDLSPFQTSEPPVQLFQISTGTALFHYFMIPFAIIYLKIEDKLTIKQKNIYLIGMLITFSSISTTFYYTMPLFFITILTIKHLINKKRDPQIMLSFFLCWLIIIASFLGFATMRLSIVILFAVIFLALTKVWMIIYKKMSIKTINVISYFMLVAYSIIGVLLFNPLVFANHNFTTDKQALRLYNITVNLGNGDYDKVILPILFLVFMITMLIVIFTSNKFRVYAKYIVVYSFYFLNPFALTLYVTIGIEPVISRIFAFTFIGYLIVICAFSLSKNVIVKFMVMLWATIACIQLLSDVNQGWADKRYQMKMINSNFENLASYDFEPNSFVTFDNINYTDGTEVYYTGINKIVVLNPSLSWSPDVKTCTQLDYSEKYRGQYDHCYTIYKKDKAEDLQYVYETDEFLVYKNF